MAQDWKPSHSMVVPAPGVTLHPEANTRGFSTATRESGVMIGPGSSRNNAAASTSTGAAATLPGDVI
ncbi:hypothetical protein E5D57_008967 [Metarhizium anisopliae]|nr:hypothetical protein E5D57_008967 [Metarhizium anisopliae]